MPVALVGHLREDSMSLEEAYNSGSLVPIRENRNRNTQEFANSRTLAEGSDLRSKIENRLGELIKDQNKKEKERNYLTKDKIYEYVVAELLKYFEISGDHEVHEKLAELVKERQEVIARFDREIADYTLKIDELQRLI